MSGGVGQRYLQMVGQSLLGSDSRVGGCGLKVLRHALVFPRIDGHGDLPPLRVGYRASRRECYGRSRNRAAGSSGGGE